MTRDINQWPYNGPDGMVKNYYAYTIGQLDAPVWTECTEKHYIEQMECLPPLAISRDAFIVGECYDYDERTNAPVYAHFAEVEGRYFGSLQPLKKYQPVLLKAQIKKQYGI